MKVVYLNLVKPQYGIEDFDSQIIKNILNIYLKPGSSFSLANIENTEQNIRFFLGENGYAF